jgi:hypothetical protein
MAGITLRPGETNPRLIADAVRQLAEGRSNAVGTVTLTPSVTTTTVTAPTCAPGSLVKLTPQTLHAAWCAPVTYVSNTSIGHFTITHPDTAFADKTFGWVVAG